MMSLFNIETANTISHSIYQEPEWKRWLVEPRPGPATDILKYWAAKQYQYPIIAAIARDHLAIPATYASNIVRRWLIIRVDLPQGQEQELVHTHEGEIWPWGQRQDLAHSHLT
jgi:hypothetical protein